MLQLYVFNIKFAGNRVLLYFKFTGNRIKSVDTN